jgi:hypothetical protein
MTRLLQDPSGIYDLRMVASIHPLKIKGDKADQTKVTETHTAISTVGGQTHHTTIPWAAASAIALEFWNEGAPPKAAAPAVPAAAPLTAEQQLAADKQQFGG